MISPKDEREPERRYLDHPPLDNLYALERCLGRLRKESEKVFVALFGRAATVVAGDGATELFHPVSRQLEFAMTLAQPTELSTSLGNAHAYVDRILSLLGCGTNVRDHKQASELTLDLILQIEQAIDDTRDLLTKCRIGTTRWRPSGSGTPVATISLRMTKCAVWMLPPINRADYDEVFRSELHDLAGGRNKWWAQVTYAFRIVARAPKLRRALRQPPGELL